MDQEIYLPYLLNYSQPVVEDIVIYCVAFLTAIIVSAEGQGFVATLLGDSEQGAKDRLHFNVFMHLSIWGTINFFVAGFGWAKKIQINPKNFKKNEKLYHVISRLAGPLSNLLMANIAASISWILGRWGFDDQVFSAIVLVNITMALYNMIPLPPLPGFVFCSVLLGDNETARKVKKILNTVCPIVIVLTFLTIRLTGYQGVADLFNPIVSAVTIFALDI